MAYWMATALSLGELLCRTSSDKAAVLGISIVCAASTMIRWANELVGSVFSACSARDMASAGFLRKASWALATCGEELAPLIIFLKKPPPPAFLA